MFAYIRGGIAGGKKFEKLPNEEEKMKKTQFELRRIVMRRIGEIITIKKLLMRWWFVHSAKKLEIKAHKQHLPCSPFTVIWPIYTEYAAGNSAYFVSLTGVIWGVWEAHRLCSWPARPCKVANCVALSPPSLFEVAPLGDPK